ncbi:MAG: hypothetical protein Q9222_001582 [Ikaeria aurantiellina]
MEKTPHHNEQETMTKAERDTQVLARLGKKSVLEIEALIQLNNPDYVPQRWEGTLLFWATVTIAVLINTVFGQLLPAIETFMLIVHVLGFFAILIPLVYVGFPHLEDPSHVLMFASQMAPKKASAHDVFTVFENGGGYPTQTASFFVGLIGTVFAMFGCDSAVHMAEEVKNADVTVPWSMLVTTLLNGAFGWAIVLATVFVTIDVEAVLASPTGALGYPYMQIFYDSVGSKGGATGMTVIILLMTVCGTIAALATSSRLIWAFARDRGLPFWRHVSKVST